MSTKARHFHRLNRMLDNLVGVLAWLLSINLVAAYSSFPTDAVIYHASLLLLVVPVQIWGFYVTSRPRVALKSQLMSVCKAMGLIAIGMSAVFFVAALEGFDRAVLLGYLIATLVMLSVVKLFQYYWYFHGRKEKQENYTKVLIVGSGPRARMVASKVHKTAEWGTEVIGYVDPFPEFSADIDGAAQANGHGSQANGHATPNKISVGHSADIQKVLSENVVDEVIIALPRRLLSDIEELVAICEEEGVSIRLVADIFDVNAAKVELTLVDGLPILDFRPVEQNMNMLIIKRIFDLAMVLLALPVLVPLFIVIGIVVKLDSKGPVFFAQTRVGLNKRQFKMFKFRSMFEDAEERLKDIEHLNEAEGPNFKIANDPRVTKAGKFLRKTSLDELPQLINVLVGSMSLVGPRPMSLRDVNLFDKSIQRRRFSVRPGCTCTWQISGRSNLTFDEWLALDLEYINNWTFLNDTRILLLTVPSIIKGAGAV